MRTVLRVAQRFAQVLFVMVLCAALFLGVVSGMAWALKTGGIWGGVGIIFVFGAAYIAMLWELS